MKISAPFIAAMLLLGISTANASNVGVDLNVQIGNPPPPPPPQVIIRETAPPSRIIVREPEPPSRTIVIEEDVDFVYPSQLGFYVGVGVPYDLFFLNNFYFTYRNGYWYRAHNHRGPWVEVQRKHLPYGLRKHKLDRIRYYRDHEHRSYERERDHYRGRHFRSERGEWKDRKRADKEYRKEEKRRDKEERREYREYRNDDRGDRGQGRGHGGKGKD